MKIFHLQGMKDICQIGPRLYMEEWADGLRHIRNKIYKIRLRFCWKATAIIVNRWDTPAFCHRAEEGRRGLVHT